MSDELIKMGARLDGVEQRLDGVEQRLDGVEQRLDGVEQRLDGVEQRLDGVEDRLDRVEDRLDTVVENQAFIIGKLSDYSEEQRREREETRRFMQVLTEQHRDDMRALLDGITGNRERIVQVEERVTTLEEAS